MSIVCFTHSRDFDGHCSGAIVKKAYPDAEIIGYDYGEPFPWEKIPGNEIVMVDVSMPMEDMARIAIEAQTFTWIDHHKSAIDDYAEKRFLIPGLPDMFTFLRVGSAACELAWEHFFGEFNMPYAVFLLGTYDVWRNKDKALWDNQVMPFQYGMRMKCNSAASFPMDLLDTEKVITDVDEYIRLGNPLYTYQKTQNEGLMKSSFEAKVRTYRAICCNVGAVNFNSQSFASVFDPAKHDIMVPFCFLGPGKGFRVSFYSEDDGPDVSVLAKSFNGGGHMHASGTTVNNIHDVIDTI